MCLAQKSFRARLTPKPWRCNCTLPPGRHPRDGEAQRVFDNWLREYETAAHRHATCRYLETIGNANPLSTMRQIVDLHDRLTRSGESLPLA